jgi:gas vesicle protein
MKKKDDTSMKTALLFMTAGMAGALFALLFAPQSGKKTRRTIQKAGQNLTERAEAFQEELSERVEGLVDNALTIAEQGLHKGKEIPDKVQEELLSTLQASKELISNQIERAHNLVHK